LFFLLVFLLSVASTNSLSKQSLNALFRHPSTTHRKAFINRIDIVNGLSLSIKTDARTVKFAIRYAPNNYGHGFENHGRSVGHIYWNPRTSDNQKPTIEKQHDSEGHTRHEKCSRLVYNKQIRTNEITSLTIQGTDTSRFAPDENSEVDIG
jgi:hypothetical protein